MVKEINKIFHFNSLWVGKNSDLDPPGIMLPYKWHIYFVHRPRVKIRSPSLI